VEPASGLLRQVMEKPVCFQIVAVEGDGVNGHVGAKLGLTNDGLRRLKKAKNKLAPYGIDGRLLLTAKF